jgi:hypothetical protein
MAALLAMLLKFQLNMGTMMGLTFSMAMRNAQDAQLEVERLELELQKLEAQAIPAEKAQPAPAEPKKEENSDK